MIEADLTSQYIQGYAAAAMKAGKDCYFRMPLVTHIEGNLWMGGTLHGLRLSDDYADVISLYPWEQYELGPNTTLLEAQLYDTAKIPVPEELHELAGYVVDCLADGKTLVACQAGLNRSGLISALALIKLGRTPADAIALLREKRSPLVLCNEVFEAWLLEQTS